MKILNCQVFGLHSALIRAGYPLATEIGDMSDAIRDADFKRLFSRGKKLGQVPTGTGHDKFLRGIRVQFDMIAPRYFWQEWDTYHWAESISSQSTQHCAKKFNLHKMANAYVDPLMLDRLEGFVETYNREPTLENFLRVKSNWLEGIELGRGIDLNYAQLKTMYQQRKNHQLPEWSVVFCSWVESLPYVRELGVVNDA